MRGEVCGLVRYCWVRPETTLARWCRLPVLLGIPFLMGVAALANGSTGRGARGRPVTGGGTSLPEGVLGRWERSWSRPDRIAVRPRTLHRD